MIRRLLTLVVAVAVIASMLVVGCAKPAPAPTPSPAPSPAPAPGPTPEKPIEIKIAHGFSTNTYMHQSFVELKNTWEEATGNRVKVEIYPAGQLYASEDDVLRAVSTGAIQVGQGATYAFEGFDPEFKAFGLPFMFDSIDAGGLANYERVLGTPQGKALWSRVEAKGLKFLMPFSFWGQYIYTPKPVYKLEDLTGLKIRFMSGEVMSKTAEALGFIPIDLAFGEVASALETGLVDGVMTGSSVGVITSVGVLDSCKCVIDLPVSTQACSLVVNTDFWRGLPCDIRSQLEDTFYYSTCVNMRLCYYAECVEGRKVMQEKGMTVATLSPEEKARWTEQMESVHKIIGDDIGWDMINLIEEMKYK